MLHIIIPKPCHEDWDAMSLKEQGRHCLSCAKTVVDFTIMPEKEIQNYFLNKKEERVCGRFRNEQLHRACIELPENILYVPMPTWKKFLVACLLAFSSGFFSCDVTTKGKTFAKTSQIARQSLEPIDNIHYQKQGMMGIFFTKSTKIKLPSSQNEKVLCTSLGTPSYISFIQQGDVEVKVVPEIIIDEPDSMFIKTKAIHPTDPHILPAGTGKLKEPPKKDSLDCNDAVYY